MYCQCTAAPPEATRRRQADGVETHRSKERKMCGTGSGPPESRTETEDDWTTPPAEWDRHAVPTLGMAPHGACPCRPNAQHGQLTWSTKMNWATAFKSKSKVILTCHKNMKMEAINHVGNHHHRKNLAGSKEPRRRRHHRRKPCKNMNHETMSTHEAHGYL